MNTLSVTLAGLGLKVGQEGVCITVGGTSPTGLWEILQRLAAQPPPDPLILASSVRAKTHDKYDRYLGRELLNIAYAARALDVPAAWAVLADLAVLPRPSPADCVTR
jgi:ATP-dependent Lhr-like helicase